MKCWIIYKNSSIYFCLPLKISKDNLINEVLRLNYIQTAMYPDNIIDLNKVRQNKVLSWKHAYLSRQAEIKKKQV